MTELLRNSYSDSYCMTHVIWVILNTYNGVFVWIRQYFFWNLFWRIYPRYHDFRPTFHTFSESLWIREGIKVKKSGNFDQKKFFWRVEHSSLCQITNSFKEKLSLISNKSCFQLDHLLYQKWNHFSFQVV